MAIYHLSVKLITRGAGRSSTAAAAYRAAARVRDERTGLVFDYTRKRGVEHTEIVLPAASKHGDWTRDRQQLWNAAEAAEVRKDARVAREYEVALPHELDATHRRELVLQFAREIADRHGCAVDVAIHQPHRDGDVRNHHAHLLATTRAVSERGLTTKTDIELKDADRFKRGLRSGRTEVVAIRERWAALVNEHLAEHSHAARIDHRSLGAQGVEDRDPTWHKGPAVTAIERREAASQVVERMREDIGQRLQREAELGRLEREARQVSIAIIDTTTELSAALAERENARTPTVDALRRDAQAAWLAERQGTATSTATPNETRIVRSTDLAAARQAAREAWLEQRAAAAAPTASPREHERESPRLILPEDHLSR